MPFSKEGASTGFRSYFTLKNGEILTVNSDLIVKVVRFPDVQNLTSQSSFLSLQSTQRELQKIARETPITGSYITPQVAAIENQLKRFQSGDRMVNGQWLTAQEYQKSLADAAAAAKAERDRQIAEQQAAEKAAEEKRLAEQKAMEEKQAEEQKTRERARERKEQKAAADLKRANDEFETAEKRAAENYRGASKGVLSGQVFVSTRGGQSVKLGAVQILLFARNAIDILVAGLQTYAGAKIELSREPSAAANAVVEQAEGQAAEDESFYSSGEFYFNYLRSPLQTAETDADGKFTIEVPRAGSFVIAARHQRSLWDTTEKYFWLQPVSLEGQQQRIQNLSNTNLSSAPGTASLILTSE